MSNRSGMTLIEVIVYLMISALIIIALCSISWQAYKTIHKEVQYTDTLIELACALDVFLRDIRATQKDGIRIISSDRCIMRKGGHDIGWLIKNKRLMRYKGYYNSSTDSWRNLSTSVLLPSINAFLIEQVKRNGQVIGIECTLQKKGQSLTQFICIKGGL